MVLVFINQSGNRNLARFLKTSYSGRNRFETGVFKPPGLQPRRRRYASRKNYW